MSQKKSPFQQDECKNTEPQFHANLPFHVRSTERTNQNQYCFLCASCFGASFCQQTTTFQTRSTKFSVSSVIVWFGFPVSVQLHCTKERSDRQKRLPLRLGDVREKGEFFFSHPILMLFQENNGHEKLTKDLL